MPLVKRLVRRSAVSNFKSGKHEFNRGAVLDLRVRGDEVRAHVRDSDTEVHGVVFNWQQQRSTRAIQAACSCSLFERFTTCKHLWAVVHALDAANSRIVPGAHHLLLQLDPRLSREAVAVRREWPPHARGDEGRAPARATATTAAPRAAPAARRAWEKGLAELREAVPVPAALAPAKRNPAGAMGQAWLAPDDIAYAIDPMVPGGLSVRILIRDSRQNTDNWRFVVPDARLFARLSSSEDLDLMLSLHALVDDDAEFGQRGWSPNNVPVDIPVPLFKTLLPRLCATGRFAILTSEPPDNILLGSPLRWDDGAAWHFEVLVVPGRNAHTWRLELQFRRGEEIRGLSDCCYASGAGLIIWNAAIAKLEEHACRTLDWIRFLDCDPPHTIDHDAVPAFLAALAGQHDLPPIQWPADFGWQFERTAPSPRLAITLPANLAGTVTRCEVGFDYGGVTADPRQHAVGITEPESRTWHWRDLKAEERHRDALEELDTDGLDWSSMDPWELRIPSRKLGEAVTMATVRGYAVEMRGQPLRSSNGWQFEVTSGIDWFDLKAECDFGGQTVAAPELLAALERREPFVTLADGSVALLPTDWLTRFGTVLGFGEAQNGVVRFRRSQGAFLDALLAEQASVRHDAEFGRLRERLAQFAGIEARDAPVAFTGTLRDYQKRGLGWLEFLREFGLGGCLADDMGLGKTIQVLAALEGVRAQSPGRPSLVVVPRSLVHNWKEEAARFTPQLRVLDYTGLERAGRFDEIATHDLVIATYGTIRRDIERLRQVEFEHVILDEAQAIKNARSLSAKSCRLLRARHRLALTGTPVENRIGDLWSLFEFLNPGILGRADRFRGWTGTSGAGAGEVAAESSAAGDSMQWIARALRPYILRRTKEAVLSELPAKTEQVLHCEMGTEQRRLYNEIRDHYRASLLPQIESKGMARSKIHVLEALLRLRQAACHPGLIDRARTAAPSTKVDTLLAQLDEVLAEGHKALVFSQFTSFLAIVRRHLDERKLVYEYLDGRTKDRKARVDRFQNDPICPLFLISLKAGGQGLNLTAADYVFLLDPWWNPAVEAQAVDRAHRIGQERRVFAYRLVCRDTVEEKILALQSRKRGLAEAILSQDESLLRNLTADDLRLLLE